MEIDRRDLTITRYVAKFGQLSTAHIQALTFSDLQSHTPATRTLNRLVERKYLHRIERRLVGGSQGGSGQYVYQLGPEGHHLFHEGRWTPARAINYHSLAIADCYVMLMRLEREGLLVITEYATEPECHVEIGRFYLKPDLFVAFGRPGGSGSGSGSGGARLMVEVDMATQGQRQILEKFVRYWEGYNAAEGDVWPDNQLVVFVAIDEYRAEELRRLLGRGKKEQRELFRIHTLASLEKMLRGV